MTTHSSHTPRRLTAVTTDDADFDDTDTDVEDDHDDDDDDRTPEQHMSDVARYTLTNLIKLRQDFDMLENQFDMLAGWAADHDMNGDAEFLAAMADALHHLAHHADDTVDDIEQRPHSPNVSGGDTSDR